MDKLYVMFREFNIRQDYNIEQAWKDFYSQHPDIVSEIDTNYGNVLQQYIKEQTEDWEESLDEEDIEYFTKEFNEWLKSSNKRKYQFSEVAQKEFAKWFKKEKIKYKEKLSIESIKYNHSKSVSENSRQQRNNLLIDIMEAILTHPNTASSLLNPGGFDNQQRAARTVSIFKNLNIDEIKKALIEHNVLKVGQYYKQNEVIDSLLSAPLGVLDSIESKVTDALNPLSPSTQITFHQQNMVGNKLIGIFANHNANHALLQLCNPVTLKHSITLNQKTRKTLNSIEVENLNISRNNAGWLAASVDDVKAKVLSSLNQNTFTANVTMFLSKLGFNPLEIGLFLTQPAIEEITREYFKPSNKNKNIDELINKVQSHYPLGDAYNDKGMPLNSMISSLQTALMIKTQPIETIESSILDKYKANQRRIVDLFKDILKQANKLNDFVQATRADTQGGAAGPTIADSTIKMLRLVDVNNDSLKPNYPFDGITNILSTKLIEPSDNTEIIRQKLLKSQLPFLQGFYSLGLENSQHMLNSYFPHFQDNIMSVVETIKGHTKYNRLSTKMLNTIYNELFAYIMTKNTTFSTPVNSTIKLVNNAHTREYYLKHFPEKFTVIKNKHKDIAELEFIQKLSVVKSNNKSPVDLLIFKNVGSLSTSQRESYIRDWTSLMYMENPVAQELARDLFLYNFYRNGFAFGPTSFIHLAPVLLRKQFPGYVQVLEETLQNPESIETLAPFVNQFIRNHMWDANFVSEIDLELNENLENIEELSGSEITEKVKEGLRNSSHYDYIKLQDKKMTKYFVLSDFESDEETGEIYNVTYTVIQPLGLKYTYMEYEYGVNSQDVIPMMDTSNSNYEAYNSEEVEDEKVEDTMSAETKEYYFKLAQDPNNIIGTIGDMNELIPNKNTVDDNGLKTCN